MASEFHYTLIVFGLKDQRRLSESFEIKKLLNYRSVVFAEHPARENGDCEWNGLHYHGIVEHTNGYRFDSDRVFQQIKGSFCEFSKYEKCKLPVNFLAYMQIPPRSIVFENLRNEESDLPMLKAQITPDLI